MSESGRVAHDHAIVDAIGGLLRQPLRTLLATLLAAAVLVLGSGAAVLGEALGSAALPPAAVAEVHVYLLANERDAQPARAILLAHPAVAEVRYLGRDAALAALARRFALTGGGDPLADLKSNPLPDALVARFKPGTDPDAITAALAQWRQIPLVDSVQADVDGYRVRDALMRLGVPLVLGSAALAGFGAIAGLLAALALVVRLDQDEVRALRLVGADDRMIGRSAAWSGLLMGALAATVAIALAAAALRAAGGWLQIAAEACGLDRWLAAAAPPGARFVAGTAFIAATALAGALGGRLLATRRLKRIKGP